MTPWQVASLLDDVTALVGEREAALALEQAPHGLDTWREKRWQAELVAGLMRTRDVAREAHYPSTAGRKLTHRPRCDLVLAPRGRPLRQGETLPLDLCPPEDAMWLELKLAHQYGDGGRSQASYGTRWRRDFVADLRKLAAEPSARSAGLLLLAFAADEASLARDLASFEDLLAGLELLAGFRQERHVAITERIGHRVCGVVLWPTVV